jgi:hypothetical protein
VTAHGSIAAPASNRRTLAQKDWEDEKKILEEKHRRTVESAKAQVRFLEHAHGQRA